MKETAFNLVEQHPPDLRARPPLPLLPLSLATDLQSEFIAKTAPEVRRRLKSENWKSRKTKTSISGSKASVRFPRWRPTWTSYKPRQEDRPELFVKVMQVQQMYLNKLFSINNIKLLNASSNKEVVNPQSIFFQRIPLVRLLALVPCRRAGVRSRIWKFPNRAELFCTTTAPVTPTRSISSKEKSSKFSKKVCSAEFHTVRQIGILIDSLIPINWTKKKNPTTKR